MGLRGTKFRWIHSTSSVGVMKPVAATESDAGYLKEGFWDKNKRLERPMSPRLTIWNWRWTNFCWKIRNCMACYVSSFQWSPAFGMRHGSWIKYNRNIQNRIHGSR